MLFCNLCDARQTLLELTLVCFLTLDVLVRLSIVRCARWGRRGSFSTSAAEPETGCTTSARTGAPLRARTTQRSRRYSSRLAPRSTTTHLLPPHSYRWQKFTEVALEEASLGTLASSCDEFLVHGVDVEGMKLGIDERLVELLGRWSPIPVTYAGGARSIEDLEKVRVAGAHCSLSWRAPGCCLF